MLRSMSMPFCSWQENSDPNQGLCPPIVMPRASSMPSQTGWPDSEGSKDLAIQFNENSGTMVIAADKLQRVGKMRIGQNSESKRLACGHGCRWLRQGPGRNVSTTTERCLGAQHKDRATLPSEPCFKEDPNYQVALLADLHRQHVDEQRVMPRSPFIHAQATHQMRRSFGVHEFKVVHGPEPRYLYRECRPVHQEDSGEDDDSKSWHSWHKPASRSSSARSGRSHCSNDSMASIGSRESGRSMRRYLQTRITNRQVQDVPPDSNQVVPLSELRLMPRSPSGERVFANAQASHQMRHTFPVHEFAMSHGPEPQYFCREYRPARQEDDDEDDGSKSWHSWHKPASRSSSAQSGRSHGSNDSMASIGSRESGRSMRRYLQTLITNRQVQDVPPDSNQVIPLSELQLMPLSPSSECVDANAQASHQMRQGVRKSGMENSRAELFDEPIRVADLMPEFFGHAPLGC